MDGVVYHTTWSMTGDINHVERPLEMVFMPRTHKRIKWQRYVGEYLEILRARQVHPEYVAQVDRILNRLTDYRRLDSKYVDQITGSDLQLYIGARRRDKYRGRELSIRTLNNEIEILNQVFSLAGPPGDSLRSRQNLRYTEHPPAIMPLPELRRDPRIATDDQIKAFVRSFQFATGPQPEVCDRSLFWRCVVLLECSVPLRRRALLNVPRPERLVEDREIFLPAAFNKTGIDQRFAISQTVADELARLPTQPGEPLLPWYRRFRSGHTQRNTLAYFNEVMREMQRSAGIADDQRITTKLFRSRVATLLLESHSEAIAKDALGHSHTTNTINKHYRQSRVSEQSRSAADALADHVLPLVNDAPELRVVG